MRKRCVQLHVKLNVLPSSKAGSRDAFKLTTIETGTGRRQFVNLGLPGNITLEILLWIVFLEVE